MRGEISLSRRRHVRGICRGVVAGVVACLVLAATALTSGRQAEPADARAPEVERHRALVTQYCVTCHNERANTADLALDRFDLAAVGSSAETWEKVLRKLHTGTMPPQGARRPDEATVAGLAAYLERELDRAALASPDPGRPLLHRLNRAEYANSIRDLLDLDVGAEALLPPDDSSYGFDNIADVLGVSPVLLEQYLAAARKISALAVGDPTISPSAETYRARHDLSQNRHVDGMPLGTIGGLRVRHYFPLDGEYTLQAKLFRTNLDAIRGLEFPSQLEIAIDGKQVFLGTVGGTSDLLALFENPAPYSDKIDARLQVTLPVKAGVRDVTVAFLEKPPTGSTLQLQSFLRSSADPLDYTGWPHIESLRVTGPSGMVDRGDTPSRRRIFTCRPRGPADEEACASRIIATLARRAYRGFDTAADRARLLDFYRQGRTRGDFDAGIQMALRRMLASPKFVVRAEGEPAAVRAGTPYPVGDLELASRLSFFLWSSIPDEELLELAKAGRLRHEAALEQQVRRMLADPRAQALVQNFAGQWLHLRNLQNIVPNSEEFPDFDDNLRQALRRETELFFDDIVRGDRNVVELLNGDHSFVNERLARHYGMPGIYGSQFRRVPVSDERIGLLGKGAVLLVTSHTDRTSPVLRGKWILDNLLGTPPAPPPPDVPALQETDGTRPRTMREQMELHRVSPPCASCHKVMDPLGLALENFDAVGAWRDTDAGEPIDASSQLADGTDVTGASSMRQALVAHKDVFVGTMTEKLLTYALGRGVGPKDMPAVRRIVRAAARDDYRFSSLVIGIVKSPPFLMRLKSGE
jgi:mono/diheme cytochrome c family protein